MLGFGVDNMRVICGLVAGLFFLAAVPSAQTGALSKQDVTAIGEATAALEKAIAAKNGKAAAALYAETAELYPPGLAVVKGRAAIEGALALLGALSNISLKNTSVEGRGDIAYVQGTFTVMLAPTATTKAQPAVGYFLDVRRKQPDGRWLIVAQMLSPGGR
jgi:ketosteroid isomerase-like protein